LNFPEWTVPPTSENLSMSGILALRAGATISVSCGPTAVTGGGESYYGLGQPTWYVAPAG
jgi:hypothetical protein